MKMENDAEFQPKWRYSCFTGGEKKGEHFEKEKADSVEYTPFPVSRFLPITHTPIRLLPFDFCLSCKRLSRPLPISSQILEIDFCLS